MFRVTPQGSLDTDSWRGLLPVDVGVCIQRKIISIAEARAIREIAALEHTLMILPQVPLRKPCYDFYFL